MVASDLKKKNLSYFSYLTSVREVNGVYYQNIALIGLFCSIYLIKELKLLLIPIMDLILICFVTSTFTTLFFFKFYRANLGIGWAILHNLTIGLIAISLLIWTNKLLATKADVLETANIENINLVDNHERYDRGLEPVISVKVKGTSKEFAYDQSDFKSIIKTKRVTLLLQQGFWGYWFIKDIQLLE